jgi:hypothetical protein
VKNQFMGADIGKNKQEGAFTDPWQPLHNLWRKPSIAVLSETKSTKHLLLTPAFTNGGVSAAFHTD